MLRLTFGPEVDIIHALHIFLFDCVGCGKSFHRHEYTHDVIFTVTLVESQDDRLTQRMALPKILYNIHMQITQQWR